MRAGLLPLLVTLHLLEVHVVRSQNSVCQSLQFRALTQKVQNEYLCMNIERVYDRLEQETNKLRKQNEDLYSLVVKFQDGIYKKLQASTPPSRDSIKTVPALIDVPLVHDCHELYTNGITKSGVYPLRMPDRNIVNVWCDMETDHGGWTIVQRRIDGETSFARYWDDYMFGFGNANTEYWLGNQNLHLLSKFKDYSLRFDMWDWEDNHAYALYNVFSIENEKKEFKLTIDQYSGTAGDALIEQCNGMEFSTMERDNDKWVLSCARKDESGWWFNSCGHASPNGVYIPDGQQELSPDGLIKGITWHPWKKIIGYSMKRMEMKIKPYASVSETMPTTTIVTEPPTEPPTTTSFFDMEKHLEITTTAQVDDEDDDSDYEYGY